MHFLAGRKPLFDIFAINASAMNIEMMISLAGLTGQRGTAALTAVCRHVTPSIAPVSSFHRTASLLICV
jgi:hypothetical protein